MSANDKLLEAMREIAGTRYCNPSASMLVGVAENAIADYEEAQAELPPLESYPMLEHWRVEVSTSGEQLVAIESAMLVGKPDLTEADERTIVGCAEHLLSFVGAQTQRHFLAEFNPDAGDELAQEVASTCKDGLQVPAEPVLRLPEKIKSDVYDEIARFLEATYPRDSFPFWYEALKVASDAAYSRHFNSLLRPASVDNDKPARPSEFARGVVHGHDRASAGETLAQAMHAAAKATADAYYVQRTGRYVGNSLVWICPGNSGYTTAIGEAGVFTEEEATRLNRHAPTCTKVWRKSDIDLLAVLHVNNEDLMHSNAKALGSSQ